MSLAANVPFILPRNGAGWCVTGKGEGLALTLGSAVSVQGVIEYERDETSKSSCVLDWLDTPAYRAFGFRLLREGWASQAVCRLREDGGDTLRDFFVGPAGLETEHGDSLDAWLASRGATQAWCHSWYDQMGSGDVLTQATDANQPEFHPTGFNVDQPALVFRGTATNSYMTGTWTTPFEAADAPSTVFLACEVYSLAVAAGRYFEASSSSANFPWFPIHGTQATNQLFAFIRDDSDTASTSTNIAAQDTNPHVLISRKNGTTLDYWVDTTQEGSAIGHDVGACSNLDQVVLGATNRGGALGNYMHGAIAELLVFGSALSDADVWTIRDE